MQHINCQFEGAWSFGQSERPKWYILNNKQIPGPGTYKQKNVKNTPNWSIGKQQKKASFIPKTNDNIGAGSYDPNCEATFASSIKYSIGNQTRLQKSNQIQQNGNFLFPNPNFGKQTSPKYSFGYAQSTSYQTQIPPPNIYNTIIKSRKSFNITQNYFTIAKRNPPYGQQIKNPPVGHYDITTKKTQIPIQIGTSERPGLQVSPDSPGKYYDISKNIYQKNRGFSFTNTFKDPKMDKIPEPNKYDPRQIMSKRKIFVEKSLRSQLAKRSEMQNPPVGSYNISKQINKGIKFSKQKKMKTENSQVPGPTKYQIKSQLNDILGKMRWKIPKSKQFVTPSAQQYNINSSSIQKKSRSGIIYYANRVDLSKSTTKQIGPGAYSIIKNQQKQLGKMDKSERPKIKNKNPGPGQYNIPSTIGIIPKYHKNLKKKNHQIIAKKSHTSCQEQFSKKNFQSTQLFDNYEK